MKKDDISKLLARQISLGESQAATDRIQNTAEAVAYYECRAPGQAVEGRSCVVSPDLSDMVEAVCADIAPILCGDALAEFDPSDENDIKNAAAESQAVSFMIMKKARAYPHILSALRDCLLSRVGYLHVCVETSTTSETQKHKGITAVKLDELVSGLPETHAVADYQYEQVGEVEGMPVYDATLKLDVTTQRFYVTSVAPENMIVSGELEGVDLEDAQFVAEKYWPTRAELIASGCDKSMVDRLPRASSKDNEANRQTQHAIIDQMTDSTDHVEVFNCYIRFDKDSNGKVSLWRYVCSRNGEILLEEEAHCIGYVAGAVFLVGHEHSGRSLHDKLKQIQDSKTATLRQALDNMAHMNNRRTGAIENEVNLDDLANSVPGGIIRMKSPNAVFPFPLDDISSGSLQMLQYLDVIRSEAGGASLDMQGVQAQIAGDTASGIDRQYTAKEKLASYMHKNFAETLIYSLYKVAHKQIRYYWQGGILLRTGDQFQTVRPNQWPEREGVTVKQSKRKTESLLGVIAVQEKLMAGGLDGVLVDAGRIYNAVCDLARAGDISSPDRYYVDPSSEQAKAAGQAKQQQAQQQLQIQMQMQQQILQTQVQMKALEELTRRAIAQMDTAFKYWSENLKAEVKEAEIVGGATAQLNALQIQGMQAAAATRAQSEAQPEIAA